jgi:hypothetical protein
MTRISHEIDLLNDTFFKKPVYGGKDIQSKWYKLIPCNYSMFKDGKAKIFPVICDTCDWQLQPITNLDKEYHPTEYKEMYTWLGKFQPFPKDAKPLKNCPQDGIADLLNQLKASLSHSFNIPLNDRPWRINANTDLYRLTRYWIIAIIFTFTDLAGKAGLAG